MLFLRLIYMKYRAETEIRVFELTTVERDRGVELIKTEINPVNGVYSLDPSKRYVIFDERNKRVSCIDIYGLDTGIGATVVEYFLYEAKNLPGYSFVHFGELLIPIE